MNTEEPPTEGSGTSTGTSTDGGAADDLRRFRFDLAYDGAGFDGWATQPGRRTVQGELERWIPQVLRLPGPTPLTVAGRTDAGVHARGQVAHADLPRGTDSLVLLRRLHRVLPPDIAVHRVSPAPEGFDARFSAVWRRYVYRLWDDVTVQQHRTDPLLRFQTATVRGVLDPGLMTDAGSSLLGLRDFAPFCKRRDGATTIRTLLRLQSERLDDGSVATTVVADAFCHSMVRSLMGAVSAVGTGQRDLAWLHQVMTSPSRHSQVVVLPAHGLTLEEVGYPDDGQLAARAAEARGVRTPNDIPGDATPQPPATHAPSEDPA